MGTAVAYPQKQAQRLFPVVFIAAVFPGKTGGMNSRLSIQGFDEKPRIIRQTQQPRPASRFQGFLGGVLTNSGLVFIRGRQLGEIQKRK